MTAAVAGTRPVIGGAGLRRSHRRAACASVAPCGDPGTTSTERLAHPHLVPERRDGDVRAVGMSDVARSRVDVPTSAPSCRRRARLARRIQTARRAWQPKNAQPTASDGEAAPASRVGSGRGSPPGCVDAMMPGSARVLCACGLQRVPRRLTPAWSIRSATRLETADQRASARCWQL
jgi:hypothetical protein